MHLVCLSVFPVSDHALGDKGDRTSNLMEIVTTKKTAHLEWSLASVKPEVGDLVGKMLVAVAPERPSTTEVLGHPLFWTLEEKVSFINRTNRSCRGDEGFRRDFDGASRRAGLGGAGGDWRRKQGLPTAFWPRSRTGHFVLGDRRTVRYGQEMSELVRFIRNLSQHFAGQRTEVRRAILECSRSATEGGGELSVEEHEAVVGRCFFEVYPALVVRLRRTLAELAKK